MVASKGFQWQSAGGYICTPQSPTRSLPQSSPVSVCFFIFARESGQSPTSNRAAIRDSVDARPFEKLDMDLRLNWGLGVRMDVDANDLVIRLCTRIGMLMEDSSPIALSMGTLTPNETLRTLTELEQAIEQMASLINAARVIAGQESAGF